MQFHTESEVNQYLNDLFEEKIILNTDLHNKLEDSEHWSLVFQTSDYEIEKVAVEIFDKYEFPINSENVLKLEGNFRINFDYNYEGLKARDYISFPDETFDGTMLPKTYTCIFEMVCYAWGKAEDFLDFDKAISTVECIGAQDIEENFPWEAKNLKPIKIEELISEYYEDGEEEFFCLLDKYFKESEEDFSIYPEQIRGDMERVYRKYKDQESQDS